MKELVVVREALSGAENVYQRISSFAGTDRMAMAYGDESLPYSEVAARMRRFAGYLTDEYGSDRSPVVICGDKDINIIPCMLGASLSGRAYVPNG
jgi:D-alanine--poly(phosphoribitol) ligase subunit 1